jgi:hypothetical protein
MVAPCSLLRTTALTGDYMSLIPPPEAVFRSRPLCLTEWKERRGQVIRVSRLGQQPIGTEGFVMPQFTGGIMCRQAS